MSEPDVVLPETQAVATHASRGPSFAEWMLVIATAIWGMSFALAKEAGEAMNHAATISASIGSTIASPTANSPAAEHPRVFGPIAVLGMRFTLSCIAWLVIVPAARRGWRASSVRRGGVIGVLLASGLVLQHIALDHSTEAVTAFLTSLTVIFVPLILWLFFGKSLPAAAWVGVALALPGVWLMSSGDAEAISSSASGALGGFRIGIGELLGVACAIVFAWHLPLLNNAANAETPYRMAAAQFAVVGVGCGIAALLIAFFSGVSHFEWSVLASRAVWLNVLLLVAFPTLISFGLANIYQPRVDPVRAVLIYLLEPVFAALFAWVWNGRTMTVGMIVGGALILVANALVELWPVLFSPRRRGGMEEGMVAKERRGEEARRRQ